MTDGSKSRTNKKIGELLIAAGLINEQQLNEALLKRSTRGGKVEEVIIEMGLVTEETIASSLADQLNLSIVDFKDKTISDEILKLLPGDVITKYQVIPVERIGKQVKLAMVDPLDYNAVRDIEFMLGNSVQPLVTTLSALLSFLETRMPRIARDIREDGWQGSQHIESYDESGPDIDIVQLRSSSSAPAVIRTVNKLLFDAVKTGAIDIHIEPREKEVFVRHRIDGVLCNTSTIQSLVYPSVIARLKIMARMDIGTHQDSQEGRAKIKIGNRSIDLRMATVPTLFGEKMVVKVLDKNRKLKELDDLGILPSLLKRYSALLSLPQGLIMVTGPAISGKTTTLYASLYHLRSEEVNIVTVEDPIEYQIPGVNQMHLNEPDFNFKRGLRASLQQDPDIIMVGGVNEPEHAEIVIQSALMGHLVMSTLYTHNSISAIMHLINLGIKPYAVASSLAGVVSQRLVRRNCPHCLKRYEPNSKVIEDLKIDTKKLSEVRFYHGEGCNKCGYSGYLGQIGIYEILNIDAKLRELISSRASFNEILMCARSSGMTTIEENAIYLALKKITTPEEILRVIPNEDITIKKKDFWEKNILELFA